MSWLPLEIDPARCRSPVAESIRVRQAVELVRQLPLTLGGNLSLSVLTAVALWGVAAPAYMYGWLALFWLTALPGVSQWLKYRNAPAPERVSVRLIWRATLYSIVVALPWAIGNWFLFDPSSPADQQVLIFVTGGLTAGVIASLAALPTVSLAYATVITMPLILRLLTQGDLLHAVMAIMLIIYIGYLCGFVRNAHRGLVAGAAIEKQNTLKKLEAAHHRLSQALERTAEEILLFDSSERLVLSNARPSESLPIRQDQMQNGARLADLMAATARARLIPAAVGREEAWVEEFLAWYRAPDRDFVIKMNDDRICAVTAQLTEDGDVFLVLSDITEFTAQAVIAKKSSQRLQDFAELASDCVWELDASGTFTMLAPHRPSPIPVEFLLGKPVRALKPMIHDAADWKKVAAVITSQQSFHDVRYRLQTGDRSLTVSMSGKPVIDDKGQFQGLRGTYRDVTAEVLAAEQLRAAKLLAEGASRAKSDFLAHMSHELRTPLNAIMGFSEIMALEVFGRIEQPKYREYVDHIHASGAHLLAIINDVLDISRIESGKADLKETAINVKALFKNCLRLIGGRADAAGHVITVQAPPQLPELWADERMVKQILINLLGNAVKFTPAGGQIRLRAELSAQATLRLTVSDTGPGIAEADQSRVLTPFDRGSAETRGAAQGSGLGLPLSKLLIELHGGTLHLASEAGMGTTVTAEFPPWRTRPDAPFMASAPL